MDVNAHDLIVLSVVAKPGEHFSGYDLLQALSAAGLKFGEMNIFHYYLPGEQKIPLFSLASATEPGDFNWDHLGDLSCTGLTLFMDLSQVPVPEEAFALMVSAAEQLAEDLDAELRAGQCLPWNDEAIEHYEKKVMEYS